MSTILKALEELERRGEAVTPMAPAWTAHRQRPLWVLVIGVLLILAGSVTGLLVLRAGRQSSAPVSPTGPAVVSASKAAPPAQVPPTRPTPQAPKPSSPQAAAPPAAGARDEPPWARVEKKLATAPPAPAPIPVAPRAAVPPKPRAETAAPPAAASASALVPGEPNVQLQSIAYSDDPRRRTVTVGVNGRTATLHEGESAGGIEVQLILRDAAYLRQGGSVFAVSPGR